MSSGSDFDTFNTKIAKLDQNGAVQSDGHNIEWGMDIHDNATGWSSPRRTLLENAMLSIINSLTDKVDWASKVQDKTIRDRWHKEIAVPLRAVVDESSEPGEYDYDCAERLKDNDRVTKLAADFVIDELQDRAIRSAKDGYVPVLDSGSADIVKSDSAVPRELKERLVQLTSKLAKSQPEPWWQPGEEGTVRHLIHPSIYAFEYDKTKVLVDELIPLVSGSKEGSHAVSFAEEVQRRDASAKWVSNEKPKLSPRQWLPAEVALKDGEARFASAINNLDYVEHPELYHALAELIDCAMPMWNRCLAVSYRHSNGNRVLCVDEKETYAVPKAGIPDRPGGAFFGRYGEEYDPEDGYSNDRYAQETWEKKCQFPICPPPRLYEEFAQDYKVFAPAVDLLRGYDHLQIIVKISGIYLTPEQPSYSGGSWHVEGLSNEGICATAVYYYDSMNVKKSSIAFRAGASMENYGEFEYDQSEYAGANRVFGTDFTNDEAIQGMPTVVTKQGRLLAFPNVFQHRVSSFELDDPSRPGFRKIIVLWLINPQKKIISTAHVPPQQTTMSRDEAIARQKLIMEDRSKPAQPYREQGYGEIRETYCFCEH